MLAVIGGSGLDSFPDLKIERQEQVQTPFGNPSGPLSFASRDGLEYVFLPRHGADHRIPPHRINYRANIWALKQAGVKNLIGVAAVGGIAANMGPGVVVTPDQIIDYTYGREHTFFDGQFQSVDHIEFGQPYAEELRQRLLSAAKATAVEMLDRGCYGATQGPRLETNAEIKKLQRDGVDLVGMTGMPEASLAKEAGINYACCAVVANWAAGLESEPVSLAQIEEQLSISMGQVCELLMCKEMH